jgi:ABC-2 type transport system ATP-binding protein
MIETKNLTKNYGTLTAVDDLNLTIKDGDIFGFIGPNGAGKTTTMRILVTLLEPYGGKRLSTGWMSPNTAKKFAGSSDTCQILWVCTTT